MRTLLQERLVRHEKRIAVFDLTFSETGEVVFVILELRGLIDYVNACERHFHLGCEYPFRGSADVMPAYVEDIEPTVCPQGKGECAVHDWPILLVSMNRRRLVVVCGQLLIYVRNR